MRMAKVKMIFMSEYYSYEEYLQLVDQTEDRTAENEKMRRKLEALKKMVRIFRDRLSQTVLRAVTDAIF